MEDHLLIYVRYLHLDMLVATTEYLTCVKLLATTVDAIIAVLCNAWQGYATMASVKSGVAARL